MANWYVATDGYDGNDGTSIPNAFGSLGVALNNGSLSAGDTIWMVVASTGAKFESETASAITSVDGDGTNGPIHVRATNAAGEVDGTIAVIDFTGVPIVSGGIRVEHSGYYFEHIAVENVPSSGLGWRLLSSLTDGYCTFVRCFAQDNTNTGWQSDHKHTTWIQCYSANNGGNGYQTGTGKNQNFYGCIAEDNTFLGFNNSGVSSLYFCLANDNGFHGALSPQICMNSTFYNNGIGGITFAGEDAPRVAVNCLLSENTGHGINQVGGGAENRPGKLLLNNAFYNNTSGEYNGALVSSREYEENKITLSADPFISKNYRNFALNNHPGGGQLCRSAGLNMQNKHPNTRSYLDIGAIQSPLRGIVAG